MELQPIYEKLQIQEMNQMQKSTFQASENEQDIILLSPTGSGKTLAFLFPVLRNLQKDISGIQAIILVPARELALQIEQVFKNMGTDFKVTICYGGHDKKIEINNLTQAPAVLIGTPGRIAYHLKNNNFEPKTIKTLVLDEFDKALELGFEEDMNFIINSLKNISEKEQKAPKNMSAWNIFYQYVLFNKNAWCISLVDTFVYTVRFGMITWLPLYLLQVKGFSKSEMAFAFLVFEWAAIPSTIFAGVISDKVFKGYRMPPAIIAMTLIFFCIFGYWKSDSLPVITFFAAVVGCLIYIPQFLASVQTMEVVPSFAVGSAVGLRGFMSYIVGASIGTSIFGVAVDRFGWDGGFYILFGAVLLCIFFCILLHMGAKKLQEENYNQQKEAKVMAH